MTDAIKVYRVQVPLSRDRYRVDVIARGGGTVMYKSTPCATLKTADMLARAYLARNTDRLTDTTTE